MSDRMSQTHHLYPQRLRERNPLSKELYYLGKWFGDDYLHVAVIGSRRPTAYGERIAFWIGKLLAKWDCVLISGMAMGIDGVAMKSAIQHGGRVIGVLPCGVDCCYPKYHSRLYEALKDRGLVVSEYKDGTKPRKHQFIERNKVIAEMADIVIVVEAGLVSGTMHTVKFALNVGVEIACVTGEITNEVARGCNHLLQEGAFSVESYEKFHDFIVERKKFLDISDCRY